MGLRTHTKSHFDRKVPAQKTASRLYAIPKSLYPAQGFSQVVIAKKKLTDISITQYCNLPAYVFIVEHGLTLFFSAE